jgi:hypothetical protein
MAASGATAHPSSSASLVGQEEAYTTLQMLGLITLWIADSGVDPGRVRVSQASARQASAFYKVIAHGDKGRFVNKLRSVARSTPPGAYIRVLWRPSIVERCIEFSASCAYDSQ